MNRMSKIIRMRGWVGVVGWVGWVGTEEMFKLR